MPLAFSEPQLLWLLPVALIVGFLSRRRWQPLARQAIYHPQAALLARLGRASSSSPSPLLVAAILLALLAISGPYWRGLSTTEPTLARNIMLAIDVSGSMRALSESPSGAPPASRLDIVRQAAKRLVGANPQDRFGIIVFADEAVTLLPLNNDHRLVETMISNLKPGLLGERTALGDAIALASEQLRRVASDSRLLILFSDGRHTAGTLSPDLAVTLAEASGMRIFTVAIGHSGPVFFPRGPMKSAELTRLPLAEELLADLATRTRGHYYRSDDLASLERILADISQLARVEQTTETAAGPSLVGPLLLGSLFLLSGHFWRRHLSVQP